MPIIPDVQLSGYIARQRAAYARGQAPAGPAAQTLTSVAARTAAIIRCMAVGYIAAQIVIWHSYYAAEPLRILGPVAIAAWAAVFLARLARYRPTPRLAVADSILHSAVALFAAWTVPPVMRGDTANWLYIAIAGESIVPLWFAPLALAAPLVLLLGAAYWAGAVLPASAVTGDSVRTASVALLFAVAVVAWSGYRILCQRAALADVALARADAAEREQYVALLRNSERREHERLLHDTVLNTLTALSRAGQSAGYGHDVVGRCRHDVALMEYVLGGVGTAGPSAGKAYGGIAVAVEAVAAETRARGLMVHTEVVAVGHAHGSGVDAPSPGVSLPGAGQPEIPVPVIVAVARAVREALNNVARHAGTGEAWLALRVPEPDGAAVDAGGFVVTVRDSGAGFDPDHVGPARLGLWRSIVERIADCGGAATVVSAPGKGTTVTLRWPAPRHEITPAPAPAPGPALAPGPGPAPAPPAQPGSPLW